MQDTWTYFYTIKYWDEMEEKMDEDFGFVVESSISDATRKVSEWYGYDNINEITIKSLRDGDGPLTFDMIKDTLRGFAYDKD